MSKYIKELQATAKRNKRILAMERKGLTHEEIAAKVTKKDGTHPTRQAIQQICARGRGYSE